ncbi:unnamed protein product, partial [Effrenium voratum]
YSFVSIGNCLAARTAVLLLLISYRQARWLLEQPAQSFFSQLPCWERWLCSRVNVWRGYWWMGVFGAPSAKRHCGWSNDEGFIGQLVAEGGYLSKREREAVTSAKLTRSYVDEQGRRKFVGQKLQLKRSQPLSCTWPLRFHHVSAHLAVSDFAGSILPNLALP